MTHSDPIADMLTRIRNGIMVKRETVDIPASKIKSSIALTMKEEGYIEDVEVVEGDKVGSTLRVTLKYDRDGTPAISEITRVSKPWCRVYRQSEEVPQVAGGLGVTILTTSQGIMSGRKAREAGIGGEIICTLF